MAFNYRVFLIVPGFGTPIQNDSLFLSPGNALSTTSAQTTTLSGLTPTIKQGWIRCKVYNGGGTSPTLINLTIQVTDGTTTEYVAVFNPATAISLAAATQITMVFPFLSELSVNAVKVITTLGGTAPTASLDIDIGAGN